jgi:hypothetical protein
MTSLKQILKWDRKKLLKYCIKALKNNNKISDEELKDLTPKEREDYIIKKALEMYLVK